MRRYLALLAILLLPACQEAEGWNLPMMSGGVPSAATVTDYCLSATTCSDTYPEYCTIRCEDFENSGTYCVGVAGDNNCWATATGNFQGTGQTYDFTTTHLDTLACTDKGSNALQLVSTAAANSNYFCYGFASAVGVINVSAYVNISGLTLGDGSKQSLFALMQGTTCTGEWNDVGIIRSGASYYLYLDCSSMSCAADAVGTTALTVDGTVWYRISVAADYGAANTTTLYLNGVQEAQRTDMTSVTTTQSMLYGWSSSTSRVATGITAQYDNLAIDGAAMPDRCNQ